MKKAHVVVLGAGVGGLHCAQRLMKMASPNLRITLVDQSDVHVLKADLYEVATAFNEKITEECMVDLKSTVATPILSLIDPERVQFVQDEVTFVDPKKKVISLKKNKNINYDYLVLALGSVSNFFKVPGIEKHAFPLKTVQDALAINCYLDHLFQEQWKKKKMPALYITIGGGGATGVEMASELHSSLKKLCKKYRYPRSKVHTQLIQSGQDLGGLESKGTERVLQRLEAMGVCIYRGYHINKVSANQVVMSDAKNRSRTLPSSMLIWTAGVKVSPVVATCLGEEKKGGAIFVDAMLRSSHYKDVFAVGDNAYVEDPKKQDSRLPMLAHFAWEQGNFVAHNIERSLEGKELMTYSPGKDWMILPLGGKFALAKLGPFLLSGFGSWFLRRLVIFRYHFSTMPFRRALKKWLRSGRLFEGND